MELVSTMEISGEEREIADAYARGKIDGINSNLSQQSIEAMDLKMLGWTVPSECPVQNYVDSDGVFHQRVGRLDLEDALFEYNDIYSLWSSSYIKNIAKYSTTDQISNTNFYSNMYSVYNGSLSNVPTDSFIMGTSGTLWVNNGSSTEKPSGYLYFELAEEKTINVDGNEAVTKVANDVSEIKNDLSKQCKKDDITTNETLIGTFNGKNYYRKLFTGISGSGGSVTVNVGEKIEIYNYYGRAYVYGQSGASDVKYPIPNKNYYIDSQNASETSFQLTIPTSSDTRKVDLVIEYTKVDE